MQTDSDRRRFSVRPLPSVCLSSHLPPPWLPLCVCRSFQSPGFDPEWETNGLQDSEWNSSQQLRSERLRCRQQLR